VITQVPELADGGYWYVVSVATDSDLGGVIPAGVSDSYCAWYANVGGIDCAAVRMPAPAAVSSGPDASVADVFAGEPIKPYGRIGGL